MQNNSSSNTTTQGLSQKWHSEITLGFVSEVKLHSVTMFSDVATRHDRVKGGCGTLLLNLDSFLVLQIRDGGGNCFKWGLGHDLFKVRQLLHLFDLHRMPSKEFLFTSQVNSLW